MLAPYTVTAMAEVDVETDTNVIAGALIQLTDLNLTPVTMYDDETGSNPSTGKTTGSLGQKEIWVPPNTYLLTVAGNTVTIVVSAAIDKVLTPAASYAEALALDPDFIPVGTTIDITGDDSAGKFIVKSGSEGGGNGYDIVSDSAWNSANKYWSRLQDVSAIKFSSIADFVLSECTSNEVEIISYYDGWVASVEGPRGGHKRFKTGGTNAAPTVGSAVSVSTVGTGSQAGYCWDASGAEWDILACDDISPSQLGADDSGATDSFAAISDTHVVANRKNVGVKATGEFLVNATGVISVKTHADYSMALLNIPDSVSITTLFSIDPTVEKETVSMSATNFKAGTTILPDVSMYENACISIDSGDVLLRRNGTDSVYKRDVVYHSKGGNLSHALYHDMTTAVSVIINYSENFELVFKAPTVNVSSCAIANLILCERNQVRVYGGAVSNSAVSGIPIITYLNPQKCYNVTLDGRFRDELSPFGTAYAYDYSGGFVLNPKIVNIVTPYTWGGVDGNVYRDLFVDRCISSRVGCHSGAINVTVTNCTLLEKAIQVSGGGKLTVKNSKKVCLGADGTLGFVASLVDLREDYAGGWDGDIEVDGFTIYCGDILFSDADFGIVRLNAKGNVDYGTDSAMGKNITIKNGRIIASSNVSSDTKIYAVEVLRYPETQLYNTRTLPEKITIQNVSVDIPTGSVVDQFLPFRGVDLSSSNYSGNVDVLVINSGIDFDTTALPLAQLGRSLDIQASGADLTSPNHIETYTFKDCKKVDALFRAPSGWCLKIQESGVYNLDMFYAGVDGSGSATLRDCTLFPGRYSGTAPKTYYNCTAESGGGATTVALSGGFVRAVGNSVQSTCAITGPRSYAEFYDGYTDVTYFNYGP